MCEQSDSEIEFDRLCEIGDTQHDVEVADSLPPRTADLPFIHRWLYHSSQTAATLPSAQHMIAFSLCNGYGTLTPTELSERGLTWDWSHVRDSSEEALLKVEAYLRKVGCS